MSSNDGPTIQEFFTQYGTHVCPQALLGGWWRLTAQYVSSENKTRSELRDVTGVCIQSAYEDSVSAGFSFMSEDGSGEGQGGSGKSQSHTTCSTLGKADLEGRLDTASKTTLSQE